MDDAEAEVAVAMLIPYDLILSSLPLRSASDELMRHHMMDDRLRFCEEGLVITAELVSFDMDLQMALMPFYDERSQTPRPIVLSASSCRKLFRHRLLRGSSSSRHPIPEKTRESKSSALIAIKVERIKAEANEVIRVSNFTDHSDVGTQICQQLTMKAFVNALPALGLSLEDGLHKQLIFLSERCCFHHGPLDVSSKKALTIADAFSTFSFKDGSAALDFLRKIVNE